MSPIARINRMNGTGGMFPVDGDVWMTMVEENNSIKYFLQSPIPQVILDYFAGRQEEISHIDFIETDADTGDIYVDHRKMTGNFVGVLLP